VSLRIARTSVVRKFGACLLGSSSNMSCCEVDVVLTSFGPFLNVSVNPSQDVMRHLALLLPSVSGGRLHVAACHVVHVTATGVKSCINEIAAHVATTTKPTLVVHLGVARDSDRPRVEMVAINDIHCPAGDADGATCDHTAIDDLERGTCTALLGETGTDGDVSGTIQTPLPAGRGWKTYNTAAHLKRDDTWRGDPTEFFDFAARRGPQCLQDAPPVALSYDAGGYLCNYLMYQSLSRLSSPSPVSSFGERSRNGVNDSVSARHEELTSGSRAIQPLFFHIAPETATITLLSQAESIGRFLVGLVSASILFQPRTAAVFTCAVDPPCHPYRRQRVRELLGAICPNITIVDVTDPDKAAEESVAVHARAYLSALQDRDHCCGVGAKRARECNPCRRTLEAESDDEEHGFEGDAAPYCGMWTDALLTAATTLSAARAMSEGALKYAMNWEGGRHHAKFDSAAGFCFVNDVALAGCYLRDRGHRVLIVDVDAHHGDGTELAFLNDANVFTLSLHAFGTGIFPGTGAPESLGGPLAPNTSLNVALPANAGDGVAIPLFNDAVTNVVARFNPTVAITVVGSDAVTGDPLGNLNMTVGGIRSVLDRVLTLNLPTLLLGAGGYVDSVAAKCFAATAHRVAYGCWPADAVPEQCLSFAAFAPDFNLVQPRNAIEQIHDTDGLLPRTKLAIDHYRACCYHCCRRNVSSEACKLRV
jgi:acetoin utilization deacetylase AcuC-like enzyme/pyrrolidone-carboxylate peptidase